MAKNEDLLGEEKLSKTKREICVRQMEVGNVTEHECVKDGEAWIVLNSW